MANEEHGIKSYLYLAPESTWGSASAGPYVFLPCEKYDVHFKPERRNATPFVGLRQRKHGKNFRGSPSGGLQAFLYGAWNEGTSGSTGSKSKAQLLLDWAFGDHENVFGASMTAEWAEGPDVSNVRHTGLRINQATLRGSADSGIVEVDLDLLGKAEANFATARAIPDDMDKLQEFEFFDASLSLGGSPYTMDGFELQVQNNLKAEYQNDFNPTFLIAGQRTLTLQVTLKKNSDTWAAYRRATSPTEMAGQLILRGLHNGSGLSGTKTKVTIDFARLAYHTQQDNRSRDSLVTSPLQFDVLKQDGSQNDMVMTWGTE